MTLGVMQPYLFPYLGYFQLIKACDKFIFYDDVNFIKGGWINRNRILINGRVNTFTVHLSGASPNKLIKDIPVARNYRKVLKSIELAYARAPFFNDVFSIIQDTFGAGSEFISGLAIASVINTCNYLGLETTFEISSEVYNQFSGVERTQRLLEMCKMNEARVYINSPGGKHLYSKEDFRSCNISLRFIHPKPVSYQQPTNEFIPNLSIIDVLMNNSKAQIVEMLDYYILD